MARGFGAFSGTRAFFSVWCFLELCCRSPAYRQSLIFYGETLHSLKDGFQHSSPRCCSSLSCQRAYITKEHGDVGGCFCWQAPLVHLHWVSPVTRLSLIVYGAMVFMASTAASKGVQRYMWGALAVGVVAAGIVDISRPLAIAAIHFIVLGPVLGALAPLIGAPQGRTWLVHVAFVVVMVVGIATTFNVSPKIAAGGGVGVVFWWVVAWPSAWRRVGKDLIADQRSSNQDG